MADCMLAGWEDISQLLTVIAIFLFVLFITYFTTRFVGSYEKQKLRGRNIEVIDTCRISPSKYVQIVKIGEKYIAIGVTRDQITCLTELDPESLTLATEGNREPEEFQAFLKQARSILSRGGSKK